MVMSHQEMALSVMKTKSSVCYFEPVPSDRVRISVKTI